MSRLLNKLIYFTAALITIFIVGCMSMENGIIPSQTTKTETTFYTFGDASYDQHLKEGHPPLKHGKIVAEKVPSNYPRKFLEPDGTYAGGRVFRSIQEAQQAVVEAREKGLISKEGEWGIYQLEGDWDSYVYEYQPGDYRLRQSTRVVKRVY